MQADNLLRSEAGAGAPRAIPDNKRLWICAAAVSLAWLGLIWFRSTSAYGSLNSFISSVQLRLTRSAVTEQPVGLLERLGKPYAPTLVSLYRQEPQLGVDGAKYTPKLGDGVVVEEGLFLHDLARKINARNTLEVGFASGYSAVFLLAASQDRSGTTHTAIDPFETSDYHGVGIQLVKSVGMESRFRLMEEFSSLAIPQLAREKKKFDLIFIDGDHKFDSAFLDFTLADMVVENGGYILLHDRWMSSIQTMVRYIEKNRADYRAEFSDAVPNIAVFRKVSKDTRNWQHFVPF
ncbi:MAG: class I SAM-dependent methyltransferase [Bryobacteraceae bacterium]